MAYDGSPQAVIAGDSGDNSLTGLLSGTGQSPLTGSFLTQRGILIGNSSQGVLAFTSSTGQVLASGGVSTFPSWVNPSETGSQVLIQSQTHTGSGSVNFTTGITTAYNHYVLYFTDCIWSGISVPLIRLSTNLGSSYIAAGYFGGSIAYPYNSTTPNLGNTTVGIVITKVLNATDTISGYARLFNVTSGTGITSSVGRNVRFSTTPSPAMIRSYGVYQTANNVFNALQIINAGGGTTSGTFSLYGVIE